MNGHTFLGIVLSGIKAFFSAAVQIAWGIASFFLFLGLLNFYQIDTTAVSGLFPILAFIQLRWFYFFCVIAIWEFIINLKTFLRPIYPTPQTEPKKEEGVKL